MSDVQFSIPERADHLAACLLSIRVGYALSAQGLSYEVTGAAREGQPPVKRVTAVMGLPTRSRSHPPASNGIFRESEK